MLKNHHDNLIQSLDIFFIFQQMVLAMMPILQNLNLFQTLQLFDFPQISCHYHLQVEFSWPMYLVSIFICNLFFFVNDHWPNWSDRFKP